MSRDEQADLKILAAAFFDNLEFNDDFENGSVGVNYKRPFGNSDVGGDILELLNCEPEIDGDWSDAQLDYAMTLYRTKLVPYLKATYGTRTTAA